MGSEDITDLWVYGTHVKRLGTAASDPNDLMRITRVERSHGRHLQRIELSIRAGDAPATWIEQIGHDERIWGCLLGSASTGTAVAPIRYVIDAVYRWPDSAGFDRAVMTQMRGRLALDNPGQLGIAAKAWAHVENGRIDLAHHWVLRNLLEEGQGLLLASPLASLVTGAVLLRADTLAPQLDWLNSAVRQYPEIADFSVMLGQAWLANEEVDVDNRLARACEVLHLLGSDPQLITSDAFSRANVLLRQLLREEAVPSANLRDVLAHSYEQLSLRSRYFRAGGLFTVFGAYQDSVGNRKSEVPRL
jgi:hypothetical protein